MGTARTRRETASTDEWIQRVQRLEAEVAGLRLAMRNRGAIEQAKGILAGRLGIDPEQAFRRMSEASQRLNIKLADIAADVLGSVVGEPPTSPVHGPAPGQSPVHSPVPAPSAGPTAPVSASGGGRAGQREARDLARRLNRLRATVGGAASPDDVVELIASEVVAGLAAQSVVLYAGEPEGGLRLIAASGLPRAVAADWRHISSAVRTPLSLAIRSGEPVWIEPPYPDDVLFIGPAGRRFALPLAVNGWQPAGLEVAWLDETPIDASDREWLVAVGQLAARRLAELSTLAVTADPDAEPDWVGAAIDATVTPAALLSPLRDDDGAVHDFVIEYANEAALAAWSTAETPIGRRLLDVEPNLLVHGGLDELVVAYQKQPWESSPMRIPTHRRAHRIGNRLLTTWLGTDADAGVGESVLPTMERLGGFGWAVWTPALTPVTWSAGLYSLLGREPGRGPIELAKIRARVTPNDQRALDDVLRAATAGDGEAAATVRLSSDEGEPRPVRVVAVPKGVAGGAVRAILTLFQDLTDARRRDDQVHRIGQRLATQQLHAATQRAQAEQLRETFFPPPRTELSLAGFQLIARHAAPRGIPDFRGDFYDISTGDDQVVLTVGDVYGAGIDAAGAMVRLRHAARALTIAGFGPADVLRLLNEELCGDDDPPLASAIVARIRADGSQLCWAQAGHYSPILIRAGRTRSLRRPRGGALGLRSDTEFTSAHARLAPRDVVVFYTDGALDREAADQPVRRLAADLLAAYADGGPKAVVDLPRPTQDEACIVALHRHPGPS